MEDLHDEIRVVPAGETRSFASGVAAAGDRGAGLTRHTGGGFALSNAGQRSQPPREGNEWGRAL